MSTRNLHDASEIITTWLQSALKAVDPASGTLPASLIVPAPSDFSLANLHKEANKLPKEIIREQIHRMQEEEGIPQCFNTGVHKDCDKKRNCLWSKACDHLSQN